jgi:hypothetical protein
MHFGQLPCQHDITPPLAVVLTLHLFAAPYRVPFLVLISNINPVRAARASARSSANVEMPIRILKHNWFDNARNKSIQWILAKLVGSEKIKDEVTKRGRLYFEAARWGCQQGHRA